MPIYQFTVSAVFTSEVEADTLEEAEDMAIENVDFDTAWRWEVDSLDRIIEDEDDEDE